MAYFAEVLGKDDVWTERAEKRVDLMNEYMLKDGLFYDYNFKKNRHSEVLSTASFYPLFARVASDSQAETAVKNLQRLEYDFGISTCEKRDVDTTYQWDYPNGWACMQYIVAKGLLNYGYTDDAKRVAKKYIVATEKIFDETENLWEKYNVIDGTINVTNEYKMPAMMGWTAGVYLAMKEIIG